MITLTMDNWDVFENLQKINMNSEIRKFGLRKENEFIKIQKNAPKNMPCARAYPFQYKLQRYIIVFARGLSMIKGVCHYIMAEVDSNKGKFYVYSEPAWDASCAISAHFFNRYNERMGYKDQAITQKICRYLVQCYHYSVIWYDENTKGNIRRVVLAVKDGLALCEHDEKHNMIFLRTFVSKAMLKDSQRRAFDLVMTKESLAIGDKMNKAFALDYMNGLKEQARLSQINRSAREQAEAIYNEYFEK